jgi:hypothetical protein
VSVDVHQGDQEGLDRTRRYLRPVADYDTDETHLSVYGWLPAFEAWATGMSLCGGSMRQGPLPEGTEVTCQGCLGYQPKYERYLAPGYDPADDDPDVLRARAEAAEALLQRYVDIAAVTHRYRIMGGHDSLGENLSCSGCALAEAAKEHLGKHR